MNPTSSKVSAQTAGCCTHLEKDVYTNKGLLVLFNHPDHLLEAVHQLQELKLKSLDAFSPFPIHGLEHALGLSRSPIPWVTFIAGLTGCTLGTLFQAWTSAVHWPINIGGKPFLSWPAFIPVSFELTILFGGLSTAAALFFFCRLPKCSTPALPAKITDDQFALWVAIDEVSSRRSEFEKIVRAHGATTLSELEPASCC